MSDELTKLFRRRIPGLAWFKRGEADYGRVITFAIQVGEPPHTLRYGVRRPAQVCVDAGKSRRVLRVADGEKLEEFARWQRDYEDGDATSLPPETFEFQGRTLYVDIEELKPPKYRDQEDPAPKELLDMFYDWLKDIAYRGDIAKRALGQ